MHNKYVIQVKQTNEWLNLDYSSGDTVIYTKSFLQAYMFDSAERAEEFLSDHNLKLKDHELFKLKVFAEPRKWSK